MKPNTPLLLMRFFAHLAFFLILAVWSSGQETDESEMPFFEVNGQPANLDLLPLKDVDASIEIVGTIAQVELVQTFANVGDEPIEAVYVFPGSTRAAVSALEMRIGDRVVEAEIQKREQARRTYEKAKSEGKTTSLLEQQRPNVFQMNLANILPGDVIEVTLRYTEWVVKEENEYGFVLPLVVGPRFSEGDSDWVDNPFLSESKASLVTYRLGARIQSAISVEEATCPSHSAEVVFHDERTALVTLEGDTSSVGNRDFKLRYRVSGDEVKSGVWISESNGEKYFMAAIEPPRLQTRKRMPREYFFIVDVSGSMSGFPLDTAKRMLERLVARLDAEDRFNLMLFSGDSSVFAERSVPATVENLTAGVNFLYRTRGGGGTLLLPAMQRVYATERDPAFSRNIVIMTDGYVTVEEEVFELIRENLNQANVFACGIGSSPNRHLIDGMSRVGTGEAFYVASPHETEEVANRFSEYVSEPVLSQMTLEFDGIDVFDDEPASLPDLLAERPVMVFGKYTGDGSGAITLSGRAGDSEYQELVDLTKAVDLAGSRSLEYVWARERIRRLSDYNQLWPDDQRVEEVTRLGLKHSLLTKYTSFVAVDREIRNLSGGDPAKIKQALPLPKGMAPGFVGSSVPVTPEPEMWALMGLVLVAVTWILVRRAY
ncbi:VIT domain-containing protein [Pelagicoccus sp. SDUM812003]|uniref:VIT domain-containing protein n=1 Tax=Pelagicoccus sp. SDUM812003 TaxID=3041267 RepID=UPI002810497C|nr:VIT domain-containing protein [Pelagicoccus sp. SDUM812003]MDQ8205287.1 VIT domain-containing protein [Pelagicoccus sp. SDUM812003]